jgi:P4 family phage/plasmid primase-like protien
MELVSLTALQTLKDNVEPFDLSYYLLEFMFKRKILSCSDKLKSFLKFQLYADNLGWFYEEVFPDDHIVPHKFSMIEVTSEMMISGIGPYETHKLARSRLILEFVCNVSNKEMDYYIGLLAYHMLCDNVVLSSPTDLWFCNMATNGLWEKCTADGFLWKFVVDNVLKFVEQEGAGAVAMHIKTGSTRSNIVRDLKLRLLDDRIESLLDSNNDLICLLNGVYNTKTRKLRNAVPADFVSITAKTALLNELELTRQTRVLTMILQTIFPNKKLYQFFIDSCCLFLEAYNSNKLLYIWWGKGNNAKTLVQRLVSSTFGQYCNSAPTSLLTGKRTSSSSATPDLCHVDKRLVVFLQEPNPDEKLKAGIVKEMTGNDAMYIRPLFKSAQTINIRAKLVLVCNNVLEIPGMDIALKRRFVVLPFISTFLPEEEYNNRKNKGTLGSNVHIINKKIEEELLSCKEAFMHMLCTTYSENKGQLHVPDIVQKHSEEYLSTHNYPLKFIELFVRHEQGNHIIVSEVYDIFKDWFKNSYPGKHIVNFDAFTAELENEGFAYTKGEGNRRLKDTAVHYTAYILQNNYKEIATVE